MIPSLTRHWFLLAALLGGMLLPNLTQAADPAPLQTVPQVDLNRYLGRWYEIATLPAWFQQDCTAVTATYSLKPDGGIRVLNECHKHTLDGPYDRAEGRAWLADQADTTKLKVAFFLWFAGDYWIIELGKDYEYAVVGHPGRKFLWILSRTPQMDETLYQTLLTRLKDQHGYDLSLLHRTLQPEPQTILVELAKQSFMGLVQQGRLFSTVYPGRVLVPGQVLKEPVPKLVALARDPKTNLDDRQDAVLALVQDPSAETRAWLRERVADEHENGVLRLHAAAVLAYQSDPTGRDYLRSLAEHRVVLTQSEFEVSYAGLALRMLGEEVAPEVFQHINSIYPQGAAGPTPAATVVPGVANPLTPAAGK